MKDRTYIDLPDDDVAEIVADITSKLTPSAAIAYTIFAGTLIGALHELTSRHEKKESQQKYTVGDWTVVIVPEASGSAAYLSISYKGEIRLARLLPSVHDAYECAFTALIKSLF